MSSWGSPSARPLSGANGAEPVAADPAAPALVIPDASGGPSPAMEWTAMGVLLATTLLHVYWRTVSLASFAAWLGALALALRFFWRGERRHTAFGAGPPLALWAVMPLALAQLWHLSQDPGHYHIDEFITGYTSQSLADVSRLDWFADFPDVWVCRFPVLFHVLQKPFFLLLGPSVESLRVSVWPYYVALAFYAAGLGRLLFSSRTGLAAGAIWLFLAGNLYLTSMGLHFISSTFLFTAALYHFLSALKTSHRRHAAAAGILAACCYLTYAGSYVALPVLGVVAALELASRIRRPPPNTAAFPRRSLKTPLLAASVLFIVTFSPFLLYALHVRNFLTERVGQVNVVSGSWVEEDKRARAAAAMTVLMSQAWDAVKAMAVPGLSGNIGYDFGHQALMDPITAALAGMGLLILLWRATRRDVGALQMFVAIGIPFVVNGVLTQHPPPFHRMSVFFPLLAVLIALPFGLAADVAARRWRPLGAILLVAGTGLVIWVNLGHVKLMVGGDEFPRYGAALASHFENRMNPGDTLTVATGWDLHVPQEMVFRVRGRVRILAVKPEYLDKDYRGGPLLLWGTWGPVLAQLAVRFPEYELLRDIDGVSLGEGALFIPKVTAPEGRPPGSRSGPVAGTNMFDSGPGSGPGLFNSPRGIAVAGNGEVFVADSENNRVQRFSPAGRYLGVLGLPGQGFDLKTPTGVAVDAEGHVIIGDAWNHRLLKVTREGGFLAEWRADLFAPFGVAVSPSGEIVVANTGQARVSRLAADGQLLSSWGKRGSGRGEFDEHTGVAVGEETVYVADPVHSRIATFTLNGDPREEWRVAEWRGPDAHWAQITLDPRRRRLYATLPPSRGVAVFDLDGTRRATLSVVHRDGSPLREPTAVAVSRDGKVLYVVDTAGNRVARLELPR